MSMRVTPGQVSVNGGSNEPDPVQVLKDQLKAKLEAAVTSRDTRAGSFDDKAVTSYELKDAISTVAEGLARAKESNPTNAQLADLAAERLLSEVLEENPEIAKALSFNAALAAASSINSKELFGENTFEASGNNLTVPLDLKSQSDAQERGVILGYVQPSELHDALRKEQAPEKKNEISERITHWYETQPGKEALVSGSPLMIAANEARKKKEPGVPVPAGFEEMAKTFEESTQWLDALKINPSELKRYIHEIEPTGPGAPSATEKMNYLLPIIFKSDEIKAFPLETIHGVLSAAKNGDRTQMPPTVWREIKDGEPMSLRTITFEGRVFFQRNIELPAGFQNGMSLTEFEGLVKPRTP